jgi:hypothetical protein
MYTCEYIKVVLYKTQRRNTTTPLHHDIAPSRNHEMRKQMATYIDPRKSYDKTVIFMKMLIAKDPSYTHPPTHPPWRGALSITRQNVI